MDHTSSAWNGSILVVLCGSSSEPSALHIQPLQGDAATPTNLLSEKGRTFWRFSIAVPLKDGDDTKITYRIGMSRVKSNNAEVRVEGKGNGTGHQSDGQAEVKEHPEEKEYAFWVPAKDETMRVLFHSCNGFSLGVKEGTFAGPMLWKDVMRGTYLAT